MNRTVKAQIVKASKVRTFREGSFCKYSHRICMQNCVDGYDYCIRHILEDKTVPFKQCAYMTKSGRRCFMAAPKQERKDGYCAEHAKKTFLARQRMSRKRRPKETVESLLEELISMNSVPSDSHSNEHRRGKMHSDSIASKALEYASSSDSESEQPMVESSWRDDGDSDAESVDSDQEDMLKYAGAYTAEEVAQILRDKLIRLQALYIDQFKRLKHVLLSKRRQYLQAYKVERETLGSIKLYKKDPSQRDKYDKLLAMKHYHKKYGKEALLQKQSTQRRMAATEGMNYPPPHFAKCVFVDEGLRCNARVVPLSKFCQKHILHDPTQVLYHPCPFADSQCGRPVPTLLNTDFCSLHQPVPGIKEPDQQEVCANASDQEDVKPVVKKETASAPQQQSIQNQIAGTSGLINVKLESELGLLGKQSFQVREVSQSRINEETEDMDEADRERHRQLRVLFTLGEENEEEEEVGIAR
uniref:KAT8 regulatory NSL complex subunit 2 n=2 Tax=Arion vulgaris TaxID=1028688 RepID=A0A0B6ZVD4_9EUPU